MPEHHHETKSLPDLARRFRLPVSRVVGVAVVGLLLLTDHSFDPAGWTPALMRMGGTALVILGTMIRVWAALYLAGHHDSRRLATEGPYSVVRNPLYIGSLLGTLGLGLASLNLGVLVLMILLFGLYYPFVVLSEEKGLARLHGEAFLEFRRRTPRYCPRPSLLREPETTTVRARWFRRYMVDTFWFLWLLVLLELLTRLHARGVLPALVRFP